MGLRVWHLGFGMFRDLGFRVSFSSGYRLQTGDVKYKGLMMVFAECL